MLNRWNFLKTGFTRESYLSPRFRQVRPPISPLAPVINTFGLSTTIVSSLLVGASRLRVRVRPSPLRSSARFPGGKQAERAWGIPPTPHQRGLRPLWTLPPGGKPSRGSDYDVQRLRGAPRLRVRVRPSPLRSSARFPGGKQAERGWGDTPKPPPKRAAPSLDSPAGREAFAWLGLRCAAAPRGAPTPRQGAPVSTPFLRSLSLAGSRRRGVGGYPQAPTKEGCALSGLFRRARSLRVARAAMCSSSAGSPPSGNGGPDAW